MSRWHHAAMEPNQSPDQRAQRLDRIQILRFFAATAVVVFHAVALAERRGLSDDVAPWARFGAQGVDLFFVISGFVIYYTVTAGSLRGLEFLRRRFERLVPIYWLFTFLVFVVGLSLPNAFASGSAETWMSGPNLLASLLFATVPLERQTIVFVGWTLEYEMLFYLATGLLLLAMRKPWAPLAIAFAAMVVIGRTELTADLPASDFFTSPLLLEFLLGIVAGQAFLARRADPLLLAAIGAGYLACILNPGSDWRVFVGLPAAGLVYLAAVRDRRAPLRPGRAIRAMLLLGDASYSIYLVQVLSIAATFKAILAIVPQFPLIALILISCATTLAAGVAMHLALERPMGRLFKRMRHRPSEAAAPREGYLTPP